MPLFFIFIVVPLLELMLLLEVGAIIGSGWTFLIIIVTAIIGTKLVKQQGLQTWSKIQQELAAGSLPAQAMFDGICILISGVLLITPGFMTDILGMLLLTPPFRKVVYSQVGHRIQVRSAGFNASGFSQHSSSSGQTFEHDLNRDNNPYSSHDLNGSENKSLNNDPTIIDGEYKRKE